jgi:hypothetical protein
METLLDANQALLNGLPHIRDLTDAVLGAVEREGWMRCGGDRD